MDIKQPEKRVWKMPELVERLLLFLDSSSILHFVQADVMDSELFFQSVDKTYKAKHFLWKHLVGLPVGGREEEGCEGSSDNIEAQRSE